MADFGPGTMLVLPDDVSGTLGILDLSTHVAVRTGTSIPDSEMGAVLSNGVFILLAYATDSFKIYNPNLTVVATPAPFTISSHINLNSPIQTVPGALAWYVSYFHFPGGSNSQFRRVAADGSLGGTTYTSPVTNMAGLAPNAAETIAYYGDGAVGGAIKRWDLVNDIALSDLVAGATTNQIGLDMAVDANGDLLVVYNANHSTHVWTILRYNPAGSLQSTITLPSNSDSGSAVRMCIDVGDPTIVWAQTFPSGSTARMIAYTIATGAVVDDFTVSNGGGPNEIPFSCPFFPWSIGGGGGGAQVFVGTAATMPIRRERTVPIPVSTGNERQTISRLEVQFQPGTGIVDDPLGEPKFMLQVSWDHGKTWSNERLMNAGREGRYLTRAYVNIVGQGRYPVVRIVTSDTFLPIMTGCSVWITESTH